jgi:hypothetical protein
MSIIHIEPRRGHLNNFKNMGKCLLNAFEINLSKWDNF